MSAGFPVIHETNLTLAWARAFIKVMQQPLRKCPPMVVSIGGFSNDLPPENFGIRSRLETALEGHSYNPCDVSAMVIFPYKLWIRRKDMSCDQFCDFCISKLLPRLLALNTANRHGTYFERMMAYQGFKNGLPCRVNQLSEVVDRLRGGKHFRATGLQMTCFDPARDHTRQPRLGFPCLQHIGVTYEGKDGIVVTGFYPSQYIFDRAYGNYLGLLHLGRFLSDQTGLKLRRMICIATRPLLSAGATKRSLCDLKRRVDSWLKEQETND